INPKYTLAYNNRGNIYKDRGDLNRAIADYTKALKYNPRYTLAYSNRGSAYEDRGDHKRAIADYRAALRYDPDYKRAKDGLKRLGARP
ncbi:MAG: tetratricopeptide repeat protein, partial [Alphaproteobacteria bacterium]